MKTFCKLLLAPMGMFLMMFVKLARHTAESVRQSHPQDWPQVLIGCAAGTILGLLTEFILPPLAWLFGWPFVQMRRWLDDVV